jgi:hypothetical protein
MKKERIRINKGIVKVKKLYPKNKWRCPFR